MGRKERRKKIIGTCRLCGENKKLTFEHIPPKCTDNNKQIKTIDMIEFMQFEGNPKEFVPTKYEQIRATGDHILCSSCNSWMGARFIKDFKKMYQSSAVFLEEENSVFIRYNEELYLNFAKQIVFMLSATSTTKQISNTELEFIKNGTKVNDIPSGYYWAVNSVDSVFRHATSGPMAIGYKNSKSPNGIEVASMNRIVHNHFVYISSNRTREDMLELCKPKLYYEVNTNDPYIKLPIVVINNMA